MRIKESNQLAPVASLFGSFLLSQAVSSQVPSALESLTSVFGMGTGVSSLLSPPYAIVLVNPPDP
jgi:hypothetical protein